MNSLVIVESGAKAEKIKSFLNKSFPDQNWSVEACVGHVRDLAEKEDAVDPNDWKNLKWEISRNNQLFPHLYGFINFIDVKKTKLI